MTAYCMLPPNLDYDFITTRMNMTFQLDGETVGSFARNATTNDWAYNYPVFNQSGLENVQHTFVISPQGQDGNSSRYNVTPYLFDSSFLPFDYITYE